jgi:hypothetical protein
VGWSFATEVGGFLKTTFDELNIFALFFVCLFVWCCCWNKLK